MFVKVQKQIWSFLFIEYKKNNPSCNYFYTFWTNISVFIEKNWLIPTVCLKLKIFKSNQRFCTYKRKTRFLKDQVCPSQCNDEKWCFHFHLIFHLNVFFVHIAPDSRKGKVTKNEKVGYKRNIHGWHIHISPLMA